MQIHDVTRLLVVWYKLCVDNGAGAGKRLRLLIEYIASFEKRGYQAMGLVRSILTAMLLTFAGGAHATLTFELETDFGNGRIDFGSTQGFIDSVGSCCDPDFTDGSPGTILDFQFDVTAASPLGPRSFFAADLFFAEWLIDGNDLELRLATFRDSDPLLREGLTLVTPGTGFSIASDTFCSSIGLSEPSDNAVCVDPIDGFASVAISDTLTVRRVPIPPTWILLGLGLVGLGLACRGRPLESTRQ